MKPSTFLCLPLTFFNVVLAANPRLALVANARFDVGTGIPAGLTPQGTFVYFPISSGTLNTTDPIPLRGRFVPGGSDYAQVRTDGSTGISVTAGFQAANGGDFFRYTSYGYVQPVQVAGNITSQFGQLDAYQIIRINTNSTKYNWLNAAALVAQERVIVVNGVLQNLELKIFRVLVRDGQTPFDDA